MSDELEASAAPKTGALITQGPRKLGMQVHHYWRCIDCKTDFASMQCNGHAIGLCPWCRPDSKA
jgi:hypothetical protein